VATVAALVHPVREDAHQLADEMSGWLGAHGHHCRLLLLTPAGTVRDADRELTLEQIDLQGTDLVVSMGGDGTFLRLVPLAWAADAPVLGVNFGRLGYLLELQPSNLLPMLERALEGDVHLSERAALEVSVVTRGAEPADVAVTGADPPERPHDRSVRGPWLALNEMVLEKTVFGHTVRLATAIDGENFLTYSADGLLVATPTGSTAYNLSAGGPVLGPGLRAMVMTPVAPHLTVDRSIVVGADQVISVRIVEERPAALVVDGIEIGRLEPGVEVTCRVADRPVRLVAPAHGFAGLLRNILARKFEP
jgi:NAD+ kinase